MENRYYDKYIKYKNKYLSLKFNRKNQLSGSSKSSVNVDDKDEKLQVPNKEETLEVSDDEESIADSKAPVDDKDKSLQVSVDDKDESLQVPDDEESIVDSKDPVDDENTITVVSNLSDNSYGAWSFNDLGDIVEGQLKNIEKHNFANIAYFKHSEPLNPGDIWNMKVVKGFMAHVGIAGESYVPEINNEVYNITSHLNLSCLQDSYRTECGSAFIFSGISQDSKDHKNFDILRELIPEKNTPYKLSIRIDKNNNIPQLMIDDSGTWTDFIKGDKRIGLINGPWFPYLEFQFDTEIQDHEVVRYLPKEDENKNEEVNESLSDELKEEPIDNEASETEGNLTEELEIDELTDTPTDKREIGNDELIDNSSYKKELGNNELTETKIDDDQEDSLPNRLDDTPNNDSK